jgi:predicted transcriptional regulator/transcriptional regulator with XRE-family HTH domain
MSRPLIGRTIRRLRQDRALTQQALAQRLGISASYLNLIEADQRGVTASLLLKLTATLQVDLAALSGSAERQLEAGLREVMADPVLGLEDVPDAELQVVASSAPNAARAVLALYRALRVAREDASGLALPSGRRILLPAEEARDFFQDRANHFPMLETAAERIGIELASTPAELNHAMAERLRQRHGLVVRVGPLEGSLRRFDPSARLLELSESLPRGSRGFQMAFQLMLLEARGAVEETLSPAAPSSPEAAALIRIGLLNYAAAALLMPYAPFLEAARTLRHDIDRLCARFGLGFEQVAHRLCTLQREGQRGVPFFFLRTDPAGNVDKRFSAAGFPFARFGGSCPRWVAHTAFASPEALQVQVAELPDGAAFLCIGRSIAGPAARWGEPLPVHVVTLGCDLSHAQEVVYADGLDLTASRVGIGLSCRLCDRADCRSRAFPPLEHRLSLDPHEEKAAPWSFSVPRRPTTRS